MDFRRVVACGDPHCGHRTGLTPPKYQTGNRGDRYHEIRRECWNFFEESINELKPIDTLICNGDGIEGKGFRSGATELIQADRGKQVDMAVECLSIADAKHIVMTYGCLTAGHRILTADLQHVPIETLRVGDKLFTFDESIHPITKRRYWRQGEVVSNNINHAEVFRINLSDGSFIEATEEHPFLMPRFGGNGSDWVTVKRLIKRLNSNYRGHKDIFFPRYIPVWNEINDYCSGYIAAFFDGEGSLSLRRKPRRGPVPETHFTLMGYQNDNAVLKTVIECLTQQGFRHGLTNKSAESDCLQLRVNGGLSEVLRCLGTNRPKRLLPKVDIDQLGAIKRNNGDETRIVSIEPVGVKEIYELTTTTGTYISEGFLSHNTPYHTGTEDDWEGMIASRLCDRGANAFISGQEWITVNGITFDIKHKVGTSSVPWGRSTAAKKEQNWNLIWSAEIGEQPKADIFLRSHAHYFDYSGSATYLAMILPALQGQGTKFGSRQCSGTVDFGLVWFDCFENGSYRWSYKVLRATSQKQESRILL